MQTAKTNLDNAIASLVLKSSSGIRYTGSISMGNRYENEPNTEISITNDSSITINAKLNVIVGSTYSYIDTPHNRKLVSNSVLPENTKITFIDKSNGEYKYYYYIVTAQDVIDSKQEYELSSFISMENHNNYINGTYFDTNRVYEDFDFIIDFKECNIKLSNGVYSVKLQSLVGTETRDMTSLSYTVSDQMGSSILSLSIGEESIKKNDILNLSIYGNRINGIYNNKEVINTNREGTKMGVKFTLWNESKTEQLQMPKNTTISFNGYTCKVSSNACILYIGDIAKSEVSDAVLKFGFDSNLEAGKYIIKGEFFRSPNGLIPETIMSSNELELIITSENQDGFKVSLDNISKNVIKEGYPHTIMYEINKSNEAEANIVLSIYKKQNNEYVIDNLSNYINDSLEPFDINKYSIGNVSAWETTLSSNIKKGTYRLAFELYRNSKLESVVYKYIVIK